MPANEEAAQRLFGNRFCFPQAFVVASLSASICVKSYSFLADLCGFYLLYANFLHSFICAHLRKIFFFFLADLRRFIFSQIYADFICFTLSFCVLLSASICVKCSFSFLADLRRFPLLYINFLRSFSASICVKCSFPFLADLRGFSILFFDSLP